MARALQGASAALVWVSGLAFLVSHVSESKLGLYMGYTMMAATLGELAGPLLGGPFYDTFGYCAVFGVVELLLAADVILRLVMKDEPSEKDRYADTNESTEREPLVGSQWSSQPPVETENATAMACQADYRSASDEEHISRLQTLRWNWLASVAATTVAVIIRCGLETVSISSGIKPFSARLGSDDLADDTSIRSPKVLMVHIWCWWGNVRVTTTHRPWSDHWPSNDAIRPKMAQCGSPGCMWRLDRIAWPLHAGVYCCSSLVSCCCNSRRTLHRSNHQLSCDCYISSCKEGRGD